MKKSDMYGTEKIEQIELNEKLLTQSFETEEDTAVAAMDEVNMDEFAFEF